MRKKSIKITLTVRRKDIQNTGFGELHLELYHRLFRYIYGKLTTWKPHVWF